MKRKLQKEQNIEDLKKFLEDVIKTIQEELKRRDSLTDKEESLRECDDQKTAGG